MDINSKITNQLNPTLHQITIGVTGHRYIDVAEDAPIRQTIQTVLSHIASRYPPALSVQFSILSPLAEGADQLVAEEVLKTKSAELEVILPYTIDEYLESFSVEGKNRFHRLLKQDHSPDSLIEHSLREQFSKPELNDRYKHAYKKVGEYVVDHCDFLIAIWDGEQNHKVGGTGSIVKYAQSISRVIYSIKPSSPVAYEIYE